MASPVNPRLHWLQELVNVHDNGVARDFAQRVGINVTSMYLYLSGERPISDKTVVKVCNKLSVRPPSEVLDYAMERKPEPMPEPQQDRTAELLARIVKAQEEQSILIKTMNELMLMMVERMKKT